MQYSDVSPRRYSSPSTSAADALKLSSSRLLASSSGVSEWLRTIVSPLRSVMYTRPAAATGEA